MTLFHRTLRAAEAIKGEDMAAVRAATRLAPPAPAEAAPAKGESALAHAIRTRRLIRSPERLYVHPYTYGGPAPKAVIHRTYALCGMVGYGLRPNPPNEGVPVGGRFASFSADR